MLVDVAERTENEYPPPNPVADSALRLIYTFASDSAGLPFTIQDRFLPPSAEGFDGVDCFILAGRRLIDDPAGELALRAWLEQGGTLWVMLDLADPDEVARLLGGALPPQIVDRTSLTRVQVQSLALGPTEQDEAVDLENPVTQVRVIPTAQDTVLHSANGWPASFTRPVGAGRILFTTLGTDAWVRPRMRTRTGRDPESPLSAFPDLPVPRRPLLELARSFRPPVNPKPAMLEAQVLEELVAGEVGYSVPPRNTAALIFAGFLALVLILGLGLRRFRRIELAALLGPVAALAAGGLFIILGTASRNAVPPTLVSRGNHPRRGGCRRTGSHRDACSLSARSGPVAGRVFGRRRPST